MDSVKFQFFVYLNARPTPAQIWDMELEVEADFVGYGRISPHNFRY